MRRFVHQLHTTKTTDLLAYLWDEMGSSKECGAYLQSDRGSISLAQQKRLGSDKIAACLVLQRFLDHMNGLRMRSSGGSSVENLLLSSKFFQRDAAVLNNDISWISQIPVTDKYVIRSSQSSRRPSEPS